ncbi:lysoplasmalogenase [Dyadobacter luteus]|jgi:uncharacterized membrane protein YhhN|uniref:Lysoplasmalogenase n=2 Tax=Dyadobacter luteus TaxID=2259619 RepID=A0A3D8YEY0_9BACT|nr:lysoplasmalogenase [Dyadobacter luteus]
MKPQKYEIHSDFAYLIASNLPNEMKRSILFTFLFTIITLSEIYADMTGQVLLVYLTKPLIVLSLLGFLWKNNNLPPTEYRWLVTGLLFALAGDIFLMIRDTDLFIPGLGSFLLMQICYILIFQKQISAGKFSTRSLVIGIPFLTCAFALYFLLFPELPDLLMRFAVAIYALSIAMMTWLAALRRSFVSTKSYQLVLIGAILFMISDSCIAIDKFLVAIPFRTLWIMGTYAAAQYLIVTGLQKTKQTD